MAVEKLFFAIDIDTKQPIKSIGSLKDQIKRINKELNDTPKGSKRFKELSNSLSDSKGALKSFNREINKTKSLTATMGDQFKKVGGLIAGAFAFRAIANGISEVVDIIKDFEQAGANLASVLGTTKDGIKALTEDAKRLGAVTSFTASEVTALQTEFAKLGFNEKQILDATEATLALAAATGSELGEAAAIAGATLGGFGLSAKETQRVVDVMAKSFSTSALDMEKFKESMKTAAPAAKAVGINVEETTALLGTLANAGISGSKAGNNLKTSFINLNKAGLTLDQGLERVANSEDKLGVATELVGKHAAASFLVLAEGRETTDRLTEGLNNAGGAADKMARTQLDTLEGKTKLLSSAWEGFVLSLDSGDGLMSDLIGGFLDLSTNMLNGVTAQDKMSESLVQTNMELDAEFDLLKNANLTQEQRSGLIADINTKYADYLPNLLTEASTLQEIEAAQKGANAALKDKILLVATQERLTELTKEAVEAEKASFDIQERIANLRSGAEEVKGVGGRGAGLSAKDRRAAIIKELENELEEIFIRRDAAAERVRQFQEANADLLLKDKEEEVEAIVEIVTKGGAGETKAEAKKIKNIEKQRQKAEDELFTALLSKEDKEIQALNQKFEKLFNLDVANDEQLLELERLHQEALTALIEEHRVKREAAKIKADEANKEKEVEDNNEELLAKQERQQSNLDLAAQGLQALQDLTQVFTDNKLKELKRTNRTELEAINKREEDELITRDQAEQERRALAIKTDKKAEEIQKKAFKRNKAFSLATVAVETAIAIAKASAALPPPANVPGIAAVSTLGAIQVATIAAQKFKQGGIINGPSHAQGGVSIMGGHAEVEGGEIILTKGVRENPSLLAAANRLNVAGGGQSFLQDGGFLPTFSGTESNDINSIIAAIENQNFRPVVSVTEISSAMNSVSVAENTATI